MTSKHAASNTHSCNLSNFTMFRKTFLIYKIQSPIFIRFVDISSWAYK
jgi:hypothetical protein